MRNVSGKLIYSLREETYINLPKNSELIRFTETNADNFVLSYINSGELENDNYKFVALSSSELEVYSHKVIYYTLYCTVYNEEIDDTIYLFGKKLN